jgi:hypothetical protein
MSALPGTPGGTAPDIRLLELCGEFHLVVDEEWRHPSADRNELLRHAVALENKISDTRATTLQGLAAKASVADFLFRRDANGLIRDPCDLCAASLVEDLLRLVRREGAA